jgi:hypothetical protein
MKLLDISVSFTAQAVNLSHVDPVAAHPKTSCE